MLSLVDTGLHPAFIMGKKKNKTEGYNWVKTVNRAMSQAVTHRRTISGAGSKAEKKAAKQGIESLIINLENLRTNKPDDADAETCSSLDAAILKNKKCVPPAKPSTSNTTLEEPTKKTKEHVEEAKLSTSDAEMAVREEVEPDQPIDKPLDYCAIQSTFIKQLQKSLEDERKLTQELRELVIELQAKVDSKSKDPVKENAQAQAVSKKAVNASSIVEKIPNTTNEASPNKSSETNHDANAVFDPQDELDVRLRNSWYEPRFVIQEIQGAPSLSGSKGIASSSGLHCHKEPHSTRDVWEDARLAAQKQAQHENDPVRLQAVLQELLEKKQHEEQKSSGRDQWNGPRSGRNGDSMSISSDGSEENEDDSAIMSGAKLFEIDTAGDPAIMNKGKATNQKMYDSGVEINDSDKPASRKEPTRTPIQNPFSINTQPEQVNTPAGGLKFIKSGARYVIDENSSSGQVNKPCVEQQPVRKPMQNPFSVNAQPAQVIKLNRGQKRVRTERDGDINERARFERVDHLNRSKKMRLHRDYASRNGQFEPVGVVRDSVDKQLYAEGRKIQDDDEWYDPETGLDLDWLP